MSLGVVAGNVAAFCAFAEDLGCPKRKLVNTTGQSAIIKA